jgi:gliding motility-associated-like protein
MLNKKHLIILLVTLFICNGVFCQAVVNGAGNTIQNNAVSIEYSVGEIGITTLAANPNFITQGLLQPIFRFKDCSLLNLIPTAFTPNNDHLNDCFGVQRWPATASFELSVYNRYGQMVFRTTNSLECWDGNFKGVQQPMGAYVYSIKATTGACGQISNKGTVVLIR